MHTNSEQTESGFEDITPWCHSINDEPQELRYDESNDPDKLMCFKGAWYVGVIPCWMIDDSEIMEVVETAHKKGFYRNPASKKQMAELYARHPHLMEKVEGRLVGYHDMRKFLEYHDHLAGIEMANGAEDDSEFSSTLDNKESFEDRPKNRQSQQPNDETDQGFVGSAYDEIDAELDAILEEEVDDPIPLFPEKQEAPVDKRLNALEGKLDKVTDLVAKFVANDWERSEQKAKGFNPRDCLSTEQTAQLLAYSTVHTSALARDGKLPATKHCGAWYFERQGVADWLAQKKSGAA